MAKWGYRTGVEGTEIVSGRLLSFSCVAGGSGATVVIDQTTPRSEVSGDTVTLAAGESFSWDSSERYEVERVSVAFSGTSKYYVEVFE